MGGGPPVFKPGSTCPALLWIPARPFRFRVRVFYPLRSDFPVIFRYLPCSLAGPKPQVQAPGLASFPFARRYLENRCFFLFLRVLRCFSSPRYLSYGCFTHHRVPGHCSRWVPPFGYLRVNGYLLLTAAFRSLSRPSSAPSAKASASCSSSLGQHLPCMRYAWTFLSLRTLN